VNPAYSVILFTTASGAGYGLLALLGLVGLQHGQSTSPAFAMTALVFALGLVTIGLLSSTFHLGHPERAWRALSQWRSSWLSREGIAALVTYPVALTFGAVWTGMITRPGLIAPMAVATIVMCALTVLSTGKIYSTLPTIRQWHQPLTVPVYLLLAAATGAVLLPAIATPFGRYQWFQAVLAAVFLCAALVAKKLYWNTIDTEKHTHTISAATGLKGDVRQWEVPHTNENFIQKEMGFVVARNHAQKLRRVVFFALALALCAVLLSMLWPYASWLAVVFAGTAVIVERWLFFAEAQHVSGLYYGAQSA
jgi:sulfite dehydrogenase (quinone) subunit SoeC